MTAALKFVEEPAENVERAPLTVVVAAADADRRQTICRMLGASGYEAVPLATGSELLHYLYNALPSRTRPDLVICDAELEGIDGAQVCLISRSQDALLPFIVLARPGIAGDFDSMELADEARVVPAEVDLDELKGSVIELAGDPLT
ncbi:MAG: hypothetical protein IPJ65_39670 [Archangiaceae bacterium]|nr:hypothetical protein [Archangiaceae bacterium]